MSQPASRVHTIFFAWLLLHAALTGYMLATRDSRVFEYSLLLLVLYSFIVLVAQRKSDLPAPIKRLCWASTAYLLFWAMGAFVYGLSMAAARIQNGEAFQTIWLVPVEDPLYLVLTVISILLASGLGFIGATMVAIGRNSST